MVSEFIAQIWGGFYIYLPIPSSREERLFVRVKLENGNCRCMLFQTMYYCAFLMAHSLQIDPSALKVRTPANALTSRPDINHNASEWTARQYTADILDGTFLAVVVKSSSSSFVW